MDLEIPDSATLAHLTDIARDVALACGRLITDERPADLGVAATKSSAVDVVTVMDQRSEALASQLLSQHRPDDGQFGEEGLNQPGTSGITWIVDPIDGTVNYLYGVPAYCVSVAAVVGEPMTPGAWQPVAGAVYSPLTDELYLATLGAGARKIRGGVEQQLRFAPAETLDQSLIGTGFSYTASIRAQQGAQLAALIPHVRDIRRMGSAALDLCRVADGQIDAYYERMLNPWDVAAGWLAATEAGAVVEGPGPFPTKDFTIAGSPQIIAELRGYVD